MRSFGVFASSILVLFALAVPARAQVTRYLDLLPAPTTAGLTDLNDVILFRSASGGGQAYDGPLDPDTYVIGPGDEIEINIWTPMARNFLLTITPEGTLMVPAVGEIRVAGLSLADARKKIVELSQGAFPASEITATLTEARRVRVHVSGMVKAPGTYELLASQRVADAITRAGDIMLDGGSARRVVRSRDNDHQVLDLLSFFARGDLTQNPYLEGGEHIVVMPREPLEDQLQVAGAVLKPGFLEYRLGDRISTLIRFAFGFQPRADLSNIVVTRTSGDNGRPQSYRVGARFDGLQWTIDEDMPLQRGDRVYVAFQPRAGSIVSVAVYGEVMRPGHYAIIEDSTTLSGLIEAAGGITPRASPREMTFLRTRYRSHIDGDTIPPIVSTSLEQLLAGDSSFDVPLKNGDSINIPPQLLGVQVWGQVLRPGILTYEPGQTLGSYIERAGGFAPEADKGKMELVRGLTGTVERAHIDRSAGPGDRVMIPARKGGTTLGTVRNIFAVVGVAAVAGLIVWGVTQ